MTPYTVSPEAWTTGDGRTDGTLCGLLMPGTAWSTNCSTVYCAETSVGATHTSPPVSATPPELLVVQIPVVIAQPASRRVGGYHRPGGQIQNVADRVDARGARQREDQDDLSPQPGPGRCRSRRGRAAPRRRCLRPASGRQDGRRARGPPGQGYSRRRSCTVSLRTTVVAVPSPTRRSGDAAHGCSCSPSSADRPEAGIGSRSPGASRPATESPRPARRRACGDAEGAVRPAARSLEEFDAQARKRAQTLGSPAPAHQHLTRTGQPQKRHYLRPPHPKRRQSRKTAGTGPNEEGTCDSGGCRRDFRSGAARR